MTAVVQEYSVYISSLVHALVLTKKTKFNEALLDTGTSSIIFYLRVDTNGRLSASDAD